jgi:hypothetical protein
LQGEVISLSPNGKHLRTVKFDGTNGADPDAPLIQGSGGRLFGVTQAGGTVQQGDVASGVVFTLDAGLAAPKPALVSFNPSRGKVGTRVNIHENHFLGTTTVAGIRDVNYAFPWICGFKPLSSSSGLVFYEGFNPKFSMTPVIGSPVIPNLWKPNCVPTCFPFSKRPKSVNTTLLLRYATPPLPCSILFSARPTTPTASLGESNQATKLLLSASQRRVRLCQLKSEHNFPAPANQVAGATVGRSL